MNRYRLRLIPGVFGVLLAAGLTACADAPPKQAKLTYQTRPEGALLYEGGQEIGMAPVTRTYGWDGKSAAITTPDVTAVWPSGAKTSFFTYLPPGTDRMATLERPEKAPGLQTDLDHAQAVAAARQREADRDKAMLLKDIAGASARCKAQQSGTGVKSAADNCN